jgi:hypothetical protein
MRLRRTLQAVTLAAAAALPTLLASAPAQATALDGSACDRQVCVGYQGNQNGFYASTTGFGYYGHVDLWGPGISFRNSPTKQDPSTSANGIGSTWLCAHGWEEKNGNLIDMGFPCVWVS